MAAGLPLGSPVTAAIAAVLAALAPLAPLSAQDAAGPARLTATDIQARAAAVESTLAEAEAHVRALEQGDASWQQNRDLALRFFAAGQIVRETRGRLDEARTRATAAAFGALGAEATMARTALRDLRCHLVLVRPGDAESVARLCDYPTDRNLTERNKNVYRKSLRDEVTAWSRRLEGAIRQNGAPAAGSDAARHVAEARALLQRCLAIAASGSTTQMEAIKREAALAQTRAGNAMRLHSRRQAADPPELRKRAESHFAGRYQEVLDTPVPAGDPRVQAVASLLAASAAYNLFLLDGGLDEAKRAAALNALRRTRDNPSVEPDASSFSPRFLVFYDAAIPAR